MQLPNGRYTIRNSVTAAKDQTYALYNLTQEQLSHTLMPVGDYDKPHIRQIAEEIGLPVATKHDSQDICFVPDHDYASFIAQETGKESKPGNFVDEEGNIMGRHRGLIHYTIGQRKGSWHFFIHAYFCHRLQIFKRKIFQFNLDLADTKTLSLGQ